MLSVLVLELELELLSLLAFLSASLVVLLCVSITAPQLGKNSEAISANIGKKYLFKTLSFFIRLENSHC